METEKDSVVTTRINYSIPIAIVMAGLIIAGVIFFIDGKPAAIPELKVNLVDQISLIGDPMIGEVDAPIVIAEWFDYQCPACQYSELNLISPLVINYVSNGKVKIIFKDFAFLGPDSQTLALTARAVFEAYPDKFYAWHKTILANQGQENTGWATSAVINDLTARVPGIDVKVVNDLLVKNSAQYQIAIDANKAEGRKFGVNATPSFIVDDQLIIGVPQYNVVSLIIDALLK